MKKIILGLLVLIVLFISPCAEASVWSYEWYDTEIEIPVGESINNYQDIPYAKLFKNGVLLEDANVNIVNKGDWLYYLSDVNTNIIGSYKVWYKAYENEKYLPGTCHNYKCLVTFNVVDKIAPTITMLTDEIRIKKGSTYDLSSYFNISDNYDNDLRIEYYEQIDTYSVGKYDCKLVVVDKSSNQKSYAFKVEGYDDVLPKIEYVGDEGGIEVMINSTPNLKDYFKAYDEEDKDVTSRIEFPYIDTSVLGDNIYEFKVSDLSGNYASINVNVKVVDNIEPTIKLYTKEITFDFYDNILYYDFYKYIEALMNNGSILDSSLVNITHNIENKVGKYHIYYSYSDGVSETIEKIAVNVVSSKPPTINVKDITISENERIDFTQYIEVKDESDDNAYLSLIINDENVDYTKKGKYTASAYAINSSGLSTTKTFYVIVVNDDKLIGYFESEEVIYFVISIIILACGIFIVFKTKKNKKV